jgi:hypothetical protein
LLVGRRAREQLRDETRFLRSGVLALRRLESIKGFVDVVQLERRRSGSLLVARARDTRPADADFPLSRKANEKADGRRDLVQWNSLQERREL